MISWSSVPKVGGDVLEVTLLVSKDRIGEGRDKRGLAIIRSMSQAQKGREKTTDDKDGQENDQGGGKGRGGHTDVPIVCQSLLD